jgi:hypothetical protein
MHLLRGKAALLGLLTAAFVCVNSNSAQAQTNLRYKFKDGDKLRYTIEHKVHTHINPLGRDVDMDMAEILDVGWQVTSVDKEGNAKITQTIERLRFSLDGQGGKARYDSKEGKPIEDFDLRHLNPPLAALAGAKITLTLDALGNASDVKLPEAFSKAVKSFPGIGVEMGEYFSEDGLKRMLCQLLPVLPKEPAVKDKSWDSTIVLTMSLGKMRLINRFTYEGSTTRGGKTLEEIGLKPRINVMGDPNKPFVTLTLKAHEAKGAALFDNSAGRLVETSVSQNSEMDLGPKSQIITRKAKATLSMKLAE